MNVVIQAHSSRVQIVGYLQAHLPGAMVSWAREDRSPAEDFAASVELANGCAHLHMEDDVVLAKGFVGRVERAITVDPLVPQSFFCTDDRFGLQPGRTARYLQAFYFPTFLAQALPSRVRQWQFEQRLKGRPENQVQMAFDNVVGQTLAALGVRWVQHEPSLVQHAGAAFSTLTQRPSARHRVARSFGDPELDGWPDMELWERTQRLVAS